MKSMLSGQTPVRSLLKLRPMAIAILDKRRLRYWDALDRPLGDLFQSHSQAGHRPSDGIDDFLEEVSRAHVPTPDTDWSAGPLYMLIDYLTHEHRTLLLHEIADIAHLLDVHTLADDEETRLLRPFQSEFQAWVREFQVHVEQEEGFLFPKVLRYEACLRDRNVHPEFHRGSVQSYMAAREARDGRRFYLTCDALSRRIQAHADAHPDSAAAADLASLAARLNAKLAAHLDLENKILYVAARDLERSLYNRSIDGDPTVVGQRRGPMDSGIMRLEEV